MAEIADRGSLRLPHSQLEDVGGILSPQGGRLVPSL